VVRVAICSVACALSQAVRVERRRVIAAYASRPKMLPMLQHLSDGRAIALSHVPPTHLCTRHRRVIEHGVHSAVRTDLWCQHLSSAVTLLFNRPRIPFSMKKCSHTRCNSLLDMVLILKGRRAFENL
jgi:hypothetical protein